MPTRTCVGCQKADAQARLVRWVIEASGRVKMDERSRQSGRGAYLHRVWECVAQAVQKGGFARSFRRRTQGLDAARLWETMQATMNGAKDNKES